MGQFIDLTGRDYGRLTVVRRAADRVLPGGQRQLTWLCRCECGSETTVRGQDLRRGRTKSCGCGQAPIPKEEVGYQGAHSRVRALKGSPSEHPCIDCGRPGRDWSYVGGCPRERVSTDKKSKGCVYSPDPDRYVPRCKLCHTWFDAERRAA